MFLSDISIKRPILISMLLIGLLVFGGLAYLSLPLDMFPEMDIGFVTIRTIYPGAGPREIESQVTKKIEDSVATISKIEFIQSYSMDSVCIVLLRFELGKDADLATQEVKDKVDAILNELPSDAELPLVEKMDLRAEPVMDLVLSGNLQSRELHEIADKQLKDRLSQIEGVARVNLVGGQEREIRVELDNRVVFENYISLLQLSQILKAQNLDMPGGQFLQRSQEYTVRLDGKLKTINALRNLEVPTPFGMKKLGQLAEIRDSGADIRERTIFMDNQRKIREDNVVVLSMIKSADGNTVDMVRDILRKLPEIEKELPAGCQLSIVNDRSVFIESSVQDTLSTIFMGILLTALVLLFFLHDIRSTIIVALAMPFSIISTFLLLQVSGFSLNMMSLMGLSISVGILVTNSVVVLENIFRHKEMGHGRQIAAGKGTAEIALAVIASTLTNIVVFLPIASMSSLVGQLFEEFALTVTFATIFSLLVSFTLTPMLASLILPEKDTKKHPVGKKLEEMFHRWERWYKKVLSFILATKRRGLLVLGIAFILLIASFFSAARVGFEFIPQMDEGDVQVTVELPQGYNLHETAAILKTIEERIGTYPEVKYILSRMGSINDTDIGTNLARIGVKLIPADERKFSNLQAINMFIRDLSDIPNARIRVSVKGMGPAAGNAPIQFFLQGQDIDRLEQYKSEIEKRIKDVPGLVNPNTSSRSGKPEILLIPDREKLSEAGVTVFELAMALRSAVEGIETTQYKENGDEYDIRVVMKKESVDTPEKIGNLAVVSPIGVYRLSQLASVEFTKGYSKILHKDKYKAIEFTGDVAPGFVLGDVVSSIREEMSKVNLSGGYRIDWGGSVELMEESMIDMGKTFLIALLLTYMLLAAILESLTQPLMILGTVPLALIGVFFAMDLTGKTMNIISMMAIVMLLGIVVNNAILLLDYTNILRKKGKGVTDALLEACPTRLKPILMATIAIILGMMPMALGIGSAGRELRQPLGIVSIGGLVVSSLLTLVVIPVVYNLVSRRKRKAQ